MTLGLDYDSSSDEELTKEDGKNASSSSRASASAAPSTKRRKLPQLSASLSVPAPVDDPALHQGRIRATPFVEGQFAAYIYVPVVLDRRARLRELLLEILRSAKDIVPTLHPIGVQLESGPSSASPFPSAGKRKRTPDDDADSSVIELHVSLSRPVYLRAHQRDDLKRAVKLAAKNHAPFTASFASIAALMNDERTRTFLALEVGAGHDQLRSLADALTPALRAIRQQEYYAQPRFHASVGWALLDPPAASSENASDPATTSTPSPSPSDVATPPSTAAPFPTIPAFPPDLVSSLADSHGAALASAKVSAFDVSHIHVCIGREVSKWRLAG